MKLTERLNAQIEELEAENERLKAEIESKVYEEKWRWRHLRPISNKQNLKLPIPRLEIRLYVRDEYNTQADYGLVYKHFMGQVEFVPIGSTNMNCGRRHVEALNEGDIPRRDGAHIWNEMQQLNLPGYLVNETTGEWAEICGHGLLKAKK